MNDINRPVCPFSLKQVRSDDPYTGYDAMRETAPVLWDETLQTWLVVSAAACRDLMKRDLKDIRFWISDLGDDAVLIQGKRSLKLLTGDEHRRVHAWWLRQFTIPALEPMRVAGIRPTVHRLLDRFAARGSAELVKDFASQLPIRAIAVVLGLPWEDDQWIANVFAAMKPLEDFFNYAIIGDPEHIARAKDATLKLHEILRPFAEARRDGTGDDMISRMWRDGASLLPDWDIDDVLSQARHMLFAGAETTAHTIASASYLMLTTPGLREQLVAGGDPAVRNFVEEVLRLYGPVHYRSRRATRDFELAGAQIHAGESIISVQAAANRDPAWYAEPTAIRLERTAPRDHIAFNYGPRACVGAELARIELQEAVSALLTRLPDMRLDPDAEQPVFGGFQLRDFRPINILFTPN